MKQRSILDTNISSIDIQALKRLVLACGVREHIAVTFCFLLILLALFTYFSWLPKGNEIIATSAELEKQTLILEDRADQLAQANTVLKQLQVMRALLPIMKSSLPSHKDVPELLNQVHDTLMASGLNLALFEPVAQKNEGLVSITPITIELVGRGELIAYVPNLLLSLPRKVTLASIKLTPTTGKDEWTMKATLHAYSQRTGEQPLTPVKSDMQAAQPTEAKPALVAVGEELGRVKK